MRIKEAIMDIIILKQEIFNEVEKRSSLEGYAIPDRYDQVWANNSRGELLDSYWIEGYTAVIQLLKKYLSSDSVAYTLNAFNENEKLTISVEMPSRYDDKLDGSISTDIKMLIACNIITGWLKVVLPEAASKYEEESKGYSEDLRVKLLYRKSPEDTLNSPKSDSDNISSGSESELSEAKSDSVAIVESQEVLRKANEDDVELVQGWNYRQCCSTTDCVLLVNR